MSESVEEVGPSTMLDCALEWAQSDRGLLHSPPRPLQQ